MSTRLHKASAAASASFSFFSSCFFRGLLELSERWHHTLTIPYRLPSRLWISVFPWNTPIILSRLSSLSSENLPRCIPLFRSCLNLHGGVYQRPARERTTCLSLNDTARLTRLCRMSTLACHGKMFWMGWTFKVCHHLHKIYPYKHFSSNPIQSVFDSAIFIKLAVLLRLRSFVS